MAEHLSASLPPSDPVDRAEAIEGIRRGLESAARGEGLTPEEIYAEVMRRNGRDSDRGYCGERS